MCFVFVDIVGAEKYTNFTPRDYVSCGGGYLEKIPSSLPKIISTIYTIIQIAVPVVLVILGMLDLFKSITAGKEDDIKKGRQTFIQRLIFAALVFFLALIIRFIVSVAASKTDSDNILDCMDCFISEKCDATGAVDSVNNVSDVGDTILDWIEKYSKNLFEGETE